METRIKYIKKNATEGYYAAQVKKWLFWKTIYTDAIFANITKFVNTLDQIDEFNSKTKTFNKIVYNGYAVRNVYKNTGTAYAISFFNSSAHKRKRNDDGPERTWADCNDSTLPTMEINTKTLFGKECLEPMKVKITIEKMEE